jgi:hypothetical protein
MLVTELGDSSIKIGTITKTTTTTTTTTTATTTTTTTMYCNLKCGQQCINPLRSSLFFLTNPNISQASEQEIDSCEKFKTKENRFVNFFLLYVKYLLIVIFGYLGGTLLCYEMLTLEHRFQSMNLYFNSFLCI